MMLESYDDIRYFVTTILQKEDAFFAVAAPRGEGEPS
jgi:hypothetical protein